MRRAPGAGYEPGTAGRPGRGGIALSIPFTVPGTDQGIDAVARCDAVQLFLQRAVAFPSFDLNKEIVPVRRQRMPSSWTGFPLAIELAVAQPAYVAR